MGDLKYVQSVLTFSNASDKGYYTFIYSAEDMDDNEKAHMFLHFFNYSKELPLLVYLPHLIKSAPDVRDVFKIMLPWGVVHLEFGRSGQNSADVEQGYYSLHITKIENK